MKYSCPMKCEGEKTYDKPGKCPKCGIDLTKSKKEQMKMEVMKTYTCPMHPVSYTHLDVYKRQIKDQVEKFIEQHQSVRRIIIHFYKEISDPEELQPILKMLDSIGYGDVPAVSYTHLDVYKRQAN